MRIISGKYKGKKIDGFDIDGTRPTKDRVKESIMAMIQSKINKSITIFLKCYRNVKYILQMSQYT